MNRRFAQAAFVAAVMSAPVFAGVMIAPQAQADPSLHDVSYAEPVTINTPDGPKTVYRGQTVAVLTPQLGNTLKQQKRDAGLKANSSSVSYPGPKNPASRLP